MQSKAFDPVDLRDLLPTDPEELNAVEDRFWSKVRIVDDNTSCWEWQSATGQGGYGKLAVNGKLISAHRLALFFDSPLTYKRYGQVLHTCPTQDNCTCCNPAHLRYGTEADNALDTVCHPHPYVRAKTVWSKQIEKVREGFLRGDTYMQISNTLRLPIVQILEIVRANKMILEKKALTK